MSTAIFPSSDSPDSLPLRRFSTSDYLQMVEAGVLGPEDKVELIGGMIVDMSPAGIPHNHFLMQLNCLFAPLWDKGVVAVQATLNVAEGQVFDPDFMLLRGRPDQYKSRLPEAGDVLLVVEASETSLRRDQQVKLPAYASAGIAEYWIADLEQEVFLVHRQPEGNSYGLVETRQGDDLLSPLAAPDFSFRAKQAFE